MFPKSINSSDGSFAAWLRSRLVELARSGADGIDAPAALGAPRKSLHESEQGFLSFVTCIAVLFFTVLVALVLNSGSAVKQKVELQNSADATILTSTSLTARGMNAITLTNHMVGELTAILVIHEALGGSTMDDIIADGPSDGKKSSLSNGLNEALQGLLSGDTFRGVDEPVVKLLKRDGNKDNSGGKHIAFASIFDSRITLKIIMSLALVGRIVAEALKAIPYVGPVLSITLHIAITGVVLKIGQEILVIELIEAAAKLFSPIKRNIIERELLPFMESYGEACVKQFPIIAERVAKETAKRNGVTLFLYPQRLELPVEREPAPKQSGGGGEPSSGNRHVAGLGDLLGVVNDARDTIDTFLDNPFFGDDDKSKVNQPSRSQQPSSLPGDGFGPDDNLARKDLPKLSSEGWSEVQRSQWVRASYPYVRAWRLPIRRWFDLTLTFSQASIWYSQWTSRYALAKPYWYRTGQYAGKKSQRKLSLYVMQKAPTSGKGQEPWTKNGRQAEQMFTQMAFVHRDAKTPIGSFLFGSGPKDGMVAYGQAIVYNANPQDAAANGKQIGQFQPTIGWDTLNWRTPRSEAYEFPNGDDSPGGFPTPTVPFITFTKSDRHPSVQLNWQAKLTPVTRYGDARLTGALLMPAKIKKILMKLPFDLGTFRTH